MIAEGRVYTKQDHGTEWDRRSVDQSAEFMGFEHPFTVLGAVPTENTRGRLLELRAVANRRTDQPRFKSVLEDRADLLNLVTESHRSPLLGHRFPQRLEIFGGQVIFASGLAAE